MKQFAELRIGEVGYYRTAHGYSGIPQERKSITSPISWILTKLKNFQARPPLLRAWFVRKGLGPGLLWWAHPAPELSSCRPLSSSFTHFPTQMGWARGRPVGAMEDEVVHIAKKTDKMVQKKNALVSLTPVSPKRSE